MSFHLDSNLFSQLQVIFPGINIHGDIVIVYTPKIRIGVVGIGMLVMRIAVKLVPNIPQLALS
jgi:hypothetical protein